MANNVTNVTRYHVVVQQFLDFGQLGGTISFRLKPTVMQAVFV